jgi:hypothetical protein
VEVKADGNDPIDSLLARIRVMRNRNNQRNQGPHLLTSERRRRLRQAHRGRYLEGIARDEPLVYDAIMQTGVPIENGIVR